MAEVERDDKGGIKHVTYTDEKDGSSVRIAPWAGGGVRITTTNKDGSGQPVDLGPEDARHLGGDVIDLAGGTR